MTSEVNAAMKTNHKNLYWIGVFDDSIDEDNDDYDDLYVAFEDEISDRYGTDYFSLANKHAAHVDHCLTSTDPHDEHYFSSKKNATNCARELVRLLSEKHECSKRVHSQ